MQFKGFGNAVEVFDDHLVISRSGVLSFMAQGLKGDKSIPFGSITAVQFKKAGVMHNGYIQFSVKGGNESRGGLFAAGSDENSVIFQKKHEPEFLKLKEIVERKLLTAREVGSSGSGGSIADEIEKLASLRDRGILTATEFEQKKKALLSL